MDAVPGKGVGILNSLLVPVAVQVQDLPGTVVKAGLLPCSIISHVEAGLFNRNTLGGQRKSGKGPKQGYKQSFHGVCRNMWL